MCVTHTCGFVPSLCSKRETFCFTASCQVCRGAALRLEVKQTSSFRPDWQLLPTCRAASALCVLRNRQMGLLAAMKSLTLCCLLKFCCQVVERSRQDGSSGCSGGSLRFAVLKLFLCTAALQLLPPAFSHRQTAISVLSATLRG